MMQRQERTTQSVDTTFDGAALGHVCCLFRVCLLSVMGETTVAARVPGLVN